MAEGVRAYGWDCSAALEPSGKIVVSGAQSWTATIHEKLWRMRGDETAWLYSATARDCSAIVVATERRLIWIRSH